MTKSHAVSPDAEQLSQALGASFRAVRSTRAERGMVQIEHVSSGVVFVAIPGGTPRSNSDSC